MDFRGKRETGMVRTIPEVFTWKRRCKFIRHGIRPKYYTSLEAVSMGMGQDTDLAFRCNLVTLTLTAATKQPLWQITVR